MDERRFDDMARSLAQNVSRRGALKGFAAAVGGGVLSAMGLRSAEAKVRRVGQRCDGAGDVCGLCTECKRSLPDWRGRRAMVCHAVGVDPSCNETPCGVCEHGVCLKKQDRCEDCETCNRAFQCVSKCGRNHSCCNGTCKKGQTCCPSERECDSGNTCCGVGEFCQDGHCCAPCADGSCCPLETTCTDDGVCCPPDRACGHGIVSGAKECCAENDICVDRHCCPASQACGDVCCAANETCIDDACCPDAQVCNGQCCEKGQQCQNGICCAACLSNGNCCSAGSACINPGIFSSNFCCDQSANTPCGDNGDGTFEQCCSNHNEECCNGECVAMGCCNQGQFRAAADVCCPNGPACDGNCCESGEQCCNGSCIAEAQACCTPGTECGDGCCVDGEECCGGECKAFCGDCPPSSTACTLTDGTIVCCDSGQCCGGNFFDYCGPGAVDSHCCQAGSTPCGDGCCAGGQACLESRGDDNQYHAYCCPEGSGDVTKDGVCCPAGQQASCGGAKCCAVESTCCECCGPNAGCLEC